MARKKTAAPCGPPLLNFFSPPKSAHGPDPVGPGVRGTYLTCLLTRRFFASVPHFLPLILGDYPLDKVRPAGIWFRGVLWAVEQYPRNQVDAAGIALIAPPERGLPPIRAFHVVSNWRSSHSFPLNTFRVSLRRKAREIDEKSLVAQRIKRLSSIASKLRRLPTMKLSQMQDIGGCRAIVRSTASVKKLVAVYEDSDLKHSLVRKDDYIQEPRQSGYRSIHLVYRYKSYRKETYNGLKIEMQFRSPLQHAWATAVETVGTFVKQALKASEGKEEWLRFSH